MRRISARCASLAALVALGVGSAGPEGSVVCDRGRPTLSRGSSTPEGPPEAALAAFGEAVALDTTAAYDGFARQYADSPFASLARERVERRLFDATAARDDPEAWKAFLDRFPDSPLRPAALERMAGAEFARAVAEDTPEAYEALLARRPSGVAADHARERLEALKARTIAVRLTIGTLRYKTVQPEDVRRELERVLAAKLSRAGLHWMLIPSDAPDGERLSRYRLDIRYEETEGPPYAEGRGTNITARSRLVEWETGRILWSREIFATTSANAKVDPTAVYESLRQDAVTAFWDKFARRVDPSAWRLDAVPRPLLTFDERTYRMRVQGEYAYVGGSSRLFVVDVHDPAAPRLVASVNLGGRVRDLSVPGRYGYAVVEDPVDGTPKVVAIDLQVPAAPRRVGDLAMEDDSQAVMELDGAAIVERGDQLLSLPEGPTAPVVRAFASLRLPAPVRDLAVAGDTVVLLAGDTLYAVALDALRP